MRLEKWLISNLDDSQRRIITESINEDIVVKGVAGSGKTNLAIHRALQAKGKGNYAIVILTIALKRMIAYGMETLGLDKERLVYEWEWNNRGFKLEGEVYWDKNDQRIIYLVNDTKARKFIKIDPSEKTKSSYGIDFVNQVDPIYYNFFGRRRSWFNEIDPINDFDVNDIRYDHISDAVLYKQIEDKIDYLIIDEGQDFSVFQYKSIFRPKRNVSMSIFGDSAQQINPAGSPIDTIANALRYKCMTLEYNYRLPKTIAKVAQQIKSDRDIDLLSNNRKDGGKSDYPYYPKPMIVHYSSEKKELEGIINRIKMEDLDDVAILVPKDKVEEVQLFLSERGMQSQVFYRTGTEPLYNTVNTLDFTNNDLPCIIDYYAAKGSEFDNVFVPFANDANPCSLNEFYVACTRSSKNLYISYTGRRISYLNNVSKSDVEEIEAL